MRLLPVLVLALAGCSTVLRAEPAYTALGTEPFWSIEIGPRRMTYDTPDGGFAVPAPAPVATGTGRRYETGRITLDITPWICTDGMSDNLYADTVTAVVDGATLYGCGGGIVPEDALDGSRWWIERIDGVPVEGADYFLTFGADRLSGQAGCNGFSGPYSRSGGALRPGPIAATRMACPGARMDHERRALAVLRGAVHLEFGDNILVLHGADGSLHLRRRFHEPYAME